MTQKATKIVPVILCGGSGTRLWPMSREDMPKQFLRLIGEESLLQATAIRAMIVGHVPGDRVVTVTLESMKDSVIEEYEAINPVLSKHILSEPCPRDTAAAVALAAEYVRDTFGEDALMWILAADHHMSDIHELGQALELATIPAERGYLVTFGITPRRPETGYGYIKCAAPTDSNKILSVESFVEKPNKETAESFLKDGNYLWNSGMFLFTPKTVLASFDQHAPDIINVIRNAFASSNGHGQIPADVYSTINKQPFDKAIMEKEDRVAVVPCDPQWSDIGSWESLWEISPKDENGNVHQGRVWMENSAGCFVRSSNLLIGCAGLENIVVIETGDAILIANKENGDDLKKLVANLKNNQTPEVFKKPTIKRVA